MAVDSFYAGGLDGRHVERGSRLHRDDPLVREHPEFFKTPMMPLVDRG